VTVVACDDQFNPNLATTCGEEAVSKNAILIDGESAFGDSYGSVAVAHGIPIMPLSANSKTEITSKLAFPTGNTVVSTGGQMEALKSAGARTIALLAIDVPEIVTSVTTLQKFAAQIGVKLIPIYTPPTATDFTSYVAQAIAAGANGMFTIEAGTAQTAIFKDLRAEGKTSKQVHITAAAITENRAAIANLGSSISNGLIITANAWDPSASTTAPFLSQFFSDLKAVGIPRGQADANTVQSWGTVMLVAHALKAAHLSPTAAHVATALVARNLTKTAVSLGLSGLNFQGSAFPGNPAYTGLNYFTNSTYYFEQEGSKLVALTQTPLNIYNKVHF
jgi:ABC-type branched-subunit amino acid transport system substrate-binding protein